jgi:hypothetical protein
VPPEILSLLSPSVPPSATEVKKGTTVRLASGHLALTSVSATRMQPTGLPDTRAMASIESVRPTQDRAKLADTELTISRTCDAPQTDIEMLAATS